MALSDPRVLHRAAEYRQIISGLKMALAHLTASFTYECRRGDTAELIAQMQPRTQPVCAACGGRGWPYLYNRMTCCYIEQEED